MAHRILCSCALQQLRLIHRQVASAHSPLVSRLQLQSRGPFPGPAAKLLHTKILDKDAGLDEQRAANADPHMRPRKPASENYVERRRPPPPPPIAPEAYVTTKTEEPLPFKADDGDDPDTFGSVGGRSAETDGDEGDAREEAYQQRATRRDRRLRTMQYAWLIKDHLRENRLKEAIDVLEKRMLQEDRAKPDHYIYNLLISGCAKAGYTRKAFSLFTRMRQRGLKVTGGTYTSLFNACANAPSAVDGLERCRRLREIVSERSVELNTKNYNAMIKAYGRCGDVKTAYQLADEMKERNLPLNADTFNFLLQASASDPEYGFRHCLLTWHKMLRRGLSPDIYTFAAVLRCVRDCQFGDLESMQQVLEQIIRLRGEQEEGVATIGAGGQLLLGAHKTEVAARDTEATTTTITTTIPEPEANPTNPFSSSPTTTTQEAASTNPFNSSPTTTTQEASPTNPFSSSPSVATTQEAASTNPFGSSSSSSAEISSPESSTQLEIPNLLLPHPHLGSLVSMGEVHQPHERFLLLGGMTGFLQLMKQYKVTPNIQLMTALLEVLPPTNAAEKQLLTMVRRIGLKADIDFFNVLIKKRALRFDYEGGKEVLAMIDTAGLQPDIVTWGVLALGCQTVEAARELLQQMQANGVRMNIQILGAMLRQGCATRSFPYVVEILQISLDENVRPNEHFIRHLHNFYDKCARQIDSRHPSTKKHSFRNGHAKFCAKMRLYFEEHGIADMKLDDALQKIRERPYQHYKEADVQGLEPLKGERLARKQKVRKYIKKIKMGDLKDDDAPPAAVGSGEAPKNSKNKFRQPRLED